MEEGLVKIKHDNNLVLTTQQVTEFCGTNAVNLQVNYHRNKKQFIENEDYYLLKGNELKDFKNHNTTCNMVNKHTTSLYLWTQRGTIKHSKLIETDQAWEVFNKLIQCYFKSKEIKKEQKVMHVIQDTSTKKNAMQMKESNELKMIEIAEKLSFFTVVKKEGYSQFISAVLKKLDNTNNRLYRQTFSNIYKKTNDIYYVKDIAFVEIMDYIDSLKYKLIKEMKVINVVTTEKTEIIKNSQITTITETKEKEIRYNVRVYNIDKINYKVLRDKEN